jgi:hypothetical protein
MVVVVNGVGYGSLKESYDRGRVARGSEINVSLNVNGFWNKIKERFYKFECFIRGSTYCGWNNLGCYFDEKGVLVSIDSREEVSGDLERSFGNWGAIVADQSNYRND